MSGTRVGASCGGPGLNNTSSMLNRIFFFTRAEAHGIHWVDRIIIG
jgi:hypothetical protein